MSHVPVGFIPLHPLTTVVRRSKDGARLLYDVSPQPGDPAGTGTVTYDQDDILHVPGPGFDGFRGMSQIAGSLRLSGSIMLSADEYMWSFFRNSARPDYALGTEGALEQEQVDRLREQINERHQGVTKSWKPMVLEGGLKVLPITVSNEDAQLMEVRKFQVEDVCRTMGVPPHMVGHTEKTSSWGTGVEQMSIGFVKYTLQRHLKKFEQEINRKVFRTDRNFCKFDTSGLERGDIKTRFEAYRIALGRAGEQPWMHHNEIREREDLPPDDTLTPVAPTPQSTQGTQQ